MSEREVRFLMVLRPRALNGELRVLYVMQVGNYAPCLQTDHEHTSPEQASDCYRMAENRWRRNERKL